MLAELLTRTVKVVLIADVEEVAGLGRLNLNLQGTNTLGGFCELLLEPADLMVLLRESGAELSGDGITHTVGQFAVLLAHALEFTSGVLPLLGGVGMLSLESSVASIRVVNKVPVGLGEAAIDFDEPVDLLLHRLEHSLDLVDFVVFLAQLQLASLESLLEALGTSIERAIVQAAGLLGFLQSAIL